MYEDTIVENIQKAVEAALLGSNASRTYFTQSLLPGATTPGVASAAAAAASADGNDGKKPLREDSSARKGKEPTVYENRMVRTDSKARTLESFLQVVQRAKSTTSAPPNESDAMEMVTTTNLVDENSTTIVTTTDTGAGTTTVRERKAPEKECSDASEDLEFAAGVALDLVEVPPVPASVPSTEKPSPEMTKTKATPVKEPVQSTLEGVLQKRKAIDVEEDDDEMEGDGPTSKRTRTLDAPPPPTTTTTNTATTSTTVKAGRPRRKVLLESILQLRAEAKSAEHSGKSSPKGKF